MNWRSLGIQDPGPLPAVPRHPAPVRAKSRRSTATAPDPAARVEEAADRIADSLHFMATRLEAAAARAEAARPQAVPQRDDGPMLLAVAVVLLLVVFKA